MATNLYPLDQWIGVINPLTEMGANIESTKGSCQFQYHLRTFKMQYKYELPVASAQVKSSILLAGLAAGTGIRGIEPIQTRDHTEKMLKHFGANIETSSQDGKNFIKLASSNDLNAKNYNVVGDISSAAFLVVAALISNSPGLKL